MSLRARNPHLAIPAGLLATIAALIPALSLPIAAQEETPAARPRAAAELDPQAKHLFDKAMELMDYKQHERGLAMLNSIVRDYQGTILAHRAHMAMGRHFLDQRDTADALNHFMLLTRVLAPVPGEKQSEDEISLYQESLFQSGLHPIRRRSIRRRVPDVPPPHRSRRENHLGRTRPTSTSA